MTTVPQQQSDRRWGPNALRTILCHDPGRVVDLLGYALRVVHATLANWCDPAIYEVLTHEATIDLLNERGTRAQACRVQELRWLCNDNEERIIARQIALPGAITAYIRATCDRDYAGRPWLSWARAA